MTATIFQPNAFRFSAYLFLSEIDNGIWVRGTTTHSCDICMRTDATYTTESLPDFRMCGRCNRIYAQIRGHIDVNENIASGLSNIRSLTRQIPDMIMDARRMLAQMRNEFITGGVTGKHCLVCSGDAVSHYMYIDGGIPTQVNVCACCELAVEDYMHAQLRCSST